MLTRELHEKCNVESVFNISAKLFHHKCLDFDYKIGDGFIFYRGFEVFPSSQFSLEACQKENNFEIVKIDLQQDQNLNELLYYAVGKILVEMDTFQKAQILARLTVDRLGGEAFEEELAKVYRSFFVGQEGCEILLGDLFGSVGQCIHRAILFKFLSDSLAIPVKIIYAESGVEVYLWEQNSEYAVNLLDQPGYIRLAKQYGVDQQFNEICSSKSSLRRGSLRRFIPFNYVCKKLERSRSVNIPQPYLFSDSDDVSGFVLIDAQNNDKNLIDMPNLRDNSDASSFSGIGLPESQPESYIDQNMIYSTSYDEKSSTTDTLEHTLVPDSPQMEDFRGFDVQPQLSSEETANLNMDNSNYIPTVDKILQGVDSSNYIPTIDEILQDLDKYPTQKETQKLNNESPFATLNSPFKIIRKDNVEIVRTLAEGAFGVVSVGRLRGNLVDFDIDFNLVACKQMKPPNRKHYGFIDDNSWQEVLEKYDQKFIREAEIMTSLSHDNIVQCYGVDPDNKFIVTEYVRYGSVYDLLDPHNDKHLPLKNLIMQNLRVRLRMALQVIQGLQYLHQHIWHLDLKTQNLLVGELYNRIVVKICDFGLSRYKVLCTYNSQGAVGTPQYMAPEVLGDCEISDKADVFSFGVVLYELATLKRAWEGVNPARVIAQVCKGVRLEIPTNVPDSIKNLIEMCWAQKPCDRPNLDQMYDELKEIMRSLDTKQ